MDFGLLVDAIAIGSVYALVALGFTIIFGPTHVINFAQGEYLVLGAVAMVQTQVLWGWGALASVAGVIVAAALLGVVTERLIMLPVKLSGSRFAWIIATLAVALILQSVFALAYPNLVLRTPPLVPGEVTLLGATISWQKLVIIFGALAIMGAYDQFLKRTLYGKAIRAAALDPDATSLMGVNVTGVVVVSFVISAVITALAGVLAAPELFIEPAQGLLFTIKGFVAIVIGGLGSARGALVGGLVVGILDTVVRNLPFVEPSIANVVVVAVLAVILVIFPAGLFGRQVPGH